MFVVSVVPISDVTLPYIVFDGDAVLANFTWPVASNVVFVKFTVNTLVPVPIARLVVEMPAIGVIAVIIIFLSGLIDVLPTT